MSGVDEQRRHSRVVFFLVPADREQLPVWVFKPAERAESIAGLILDMGEGGLQILTPAEDELPDGRFSLELLVDPDSETVRFACSARRVWMHPHGSLGKLAGFEIEESSSPAGEFLAVYGPSLSQRRWVRCLLTPVHAGADAAA